MEDDDYITECKYFQLWQYFHSKHTDGRGWELGMEKKDRNWKISILQNVLRDSVYSLYKK